MSLLVHLGNAHFQFDNRVNRVLVGRDASCTLVHDDPSLSRRHAEIFLDQNHAAYIRDLGSRNGTWVDGQLLAAMPVALRPGQQIWVGRVPLVVEFQAGPNAGGATVAAEMPAELLAMMEAHRQRAPAPAGAWTPPQQQQQQSQAVAPAPVAAPLSVPAQPAQPAPAAQAQQPAAHTGGLGLGGHTAPRPAEFTYRRQDSNNNGVLLIALRSDTYSNGAVVDGYLEFTSLDNETIASITVELVEVHRKGPSGGHVWDRMLVRQGPWHSQKNEVVPMPFQLRVPPGVSMSGRDCQWEIRGLVDIDWAFDVSATSPINMRNVDIEHLRDALGMLDYRIQDIESEALGQRYTGRFEPPAQLQSQLGIKDINIAIEYLGTNMKVDLEVEKTALFRFDKQVSMTFDLAQLRAAPVQEISTFLQGQIAQLMAK